MRILLACYFYLPSTAGLWPYVRELKQALERAGHEVDIFTHHPDVLKYYIINNGNYLMKYKVKYQVQEKLNPLYDRYFPGLDPQVKDYEYERISFEVAAACFDLWKYDLIHTQDVISTRAMLHVKPKHIPLIATIHGAFANEQLLQGEIKGKDTIRWHYAYTRDYVGSISSDYIIVPSNWLKKILVDEYKVPSEKIEVVPYGIDFEAFTNRMEKDSLLGPPHNKTIIACTARLSAEKGHKYLLGALAKLKQERDDWVCWLIGDGVLREELELQAKKLNLDQNVLFMGKQNNVPALLKLVDICLLPSIQDNLPFAVMEAQLAGKPIIVTDAGGLPEMVQHRVTGLVAKIGNSESLYQNIKEIMGNKTLQKTLSNNGREFGINQWPIEKMITRLFNIYEKIFYTKNKGTLITHTKSKETNSPLISEQLYELPTPFDFHDYGNLWQRMLPKLPKEYSLLDQNFIEVLKTYKNYSS
ncbi:glycosyltransferase family 4 protein [Paenibacillus sediminis]|uniref:Glycosyltransferase involved in cell wall biosynthesis n=1 Tax=Paenibacillus sediminis TaxID=664909 RepID=A0ABS4H154_9BACL|nr:glycosyltransferase family 4 protein [Paenibacillus sediminis]MBP1936253.1 glycosyltransferase involved in cell wall biosynthesis [Paenibacillus sediminis]